MRTSRRLQAIGSLGLLLVSVASVSRAQLLFDRAGGGPNQWNGAGDVHYAGFHLTEATRITAISGWFQGGPTTTFRLRSFGPYIDNPPPPPFAISFQLNIPEGPAVAGFWDGVEALNWDLPPGGYELVIEGGRMPLGYGNYVDPPVQSQPFDYQRSYYAWDPETIFNYPFGLRLYGAALTAVPEPSTTGIAAVILLLGVVVYRRRARK